MTEALSLRRKPPSNKSMDQSFSPFVRSLPLSQTLFSKAKLIQKALLSSDIILVSDHDMRMNIYTSLYLDSHFYYRKNMTTPQHTNPCHRVREIYNSDTLYILLWSLLPYTPLYAGEQNRIFLKNHEFSLFVFYDHAINNFVIYRGNGVY